MNKKVLTMAVLAAVCGMAAAPVWAANSGGTVNDDGKYVGDKGAANNKLLIDTDFNKDIISGLGTGTDAVKNNSIEVYDFDAVDSTRARVGARVSKAYSERGTGYVGLAYEYEFDGEARATVKGFSTPSPSIKGSSGLLELGYILQPKGVNDPTINIGLQGWGGKKQGVTGNVNFVWTF